MFVTKSFFVKVDQVQFQRWHSKRPDRDSLFPLEVIIFLHSIRVRYQSVLPVIQILFCINMSKFCEHLCQVKLSIFQVLLIALLELISVPEWIIYLILNYYLLTDKAAGGTTVSMWNNINFMVDRTKCFTFIRQMTDITSLRLYAQGTFWMFVVPQKFRIRYMLMLLYCTMAL